MLPRHICYFFFHYQTCISNLGRTLVPKIFLMDLFLQVLCVILFTVNVVTPSQILWWGIVITFVCLCVCLCVTLSVNRIKGELSIRFWWKLVRLCIIIIGKFEDGLCPLIFKANTIKKPLEIMKISHYKSDFQHIDVKFAQWM